MSGYGGFIFSIIEGERASRLEEIIEESFSFTDTVSSVDLKPKTLEICFISLDGQSFSYAALARRGQKVATLKFRLRFTDLVDLDHLPISDIEADIGPRFKSHFASASGGLGGRVPPGTWNALVDCVKRLAPHAAADLVRLEKKRLEERRPFRTNSPERMAMEKDALGLSLAIFGTDRADVFQTWNSSEEESPAPFLAGLSSFTLLEDPIIFHDSQRFGDWSPLRKHVLGAVEFSKDKQKLTVMNINRTPGERAFGADLLYYHHKYKSFVLVQYKRMKSEGDPPAAVYRPTDMQYKEELERMNAFRRMHLDGGATVPDEYRLNPEAFYFKLCPSTVFKPWEAGLLKGIYWPLDGWEVLVNSPSMRGKLGGVKVTYSNVGRYIGNDLFVKLVQDGWIGSRGQVSQAIEFVQNAVLSGRSVTVALSDSVERSRNLDFAQNDEESIN